LPNLPTTIPRASLCVRRLRLCPIFWRSGSIARCGEMGLMGLARRLAGLNFSRSVELREGRGSPAITNGPPSKGSTGAGIRRISDPSSTDFQAAKRPSGRTRDNAWSPTSVGQLPVRVRKRKRDGTEWRNRRLITVNI
jgi:hypothetical protein